MSTIIKTPKAIRDLARIWHYVEIETNTERARNLIANIDQTLTVLASHPHLGRDRHDLQPGVRSFPMSNYIIIYKALSKGIAVVRILHGAMDLPQQLSLSKDRKSP